MSLITRMLKQRAILWPLSGSSFDGKPKYGTPVQIPCRWEDKLVEHVKPEEENQVTEALVYVDRDVVIHSKLQLADLTSSTPPTPPSGAWEVEQFEKFPNIHASEFKRIAYLKRS